MKQGAPRGGTVDGIRKDSLIEIAAICGITDGAVSKYSTTRGCEFVCHGHKIVLDPPRKPRAVDPDYVELDEPTTRRGPVDAMDQVRKDRRNYDERGISRHGLLMRKA